MLEEKLKNVVALGYSENIKIFKSLGVQVVQVVSSEDGHKFLEKIKTSANYWIIFVFGKLGMDLKEELEKLNSLKEFSISWLPDEDSQFEKIGQNLIKEKLRKAIGFKFAE